MSDVMTVEAADEEIIAPAVSNPVEDGFDGDIMLFRDRTVAGGDEPWYAVADAAALLADDFQFVDWDDPPSVAEFFWKLEDLPHTRGRTSTEALAKLLKEELKEWPQYQEFVRQPKDPNLDAWGR